MASSAITPEVQDPTTQPANTLDPTAAAAPVVTALVPAAAPVAVTPFERADANLLSEIAEFRADSEKRYRFNNTWDVLLSVLGILLSIVVVWAGFQKDPQVVIAILGAVVGAVITAQKAFPFGQRAGFYRLLIGQVRNLATRATQGTLGKVEVINALSSLRMDYAQQLPRGSSGPAPAQATSASGPTATPPADALPGDGDGQIKPSN